MPRDVLDRTFGLLLSFRAAKAHVIVASNRTFRPSESRWTSTPTGEIVETERLGGLLRNYDRSAA